MKRIDTQSEPVISEDLIKRFDDMMDLSQINKNWVFDSSGFSKDKNEPGSVQVYVASNTLKESMKFISGGYGLSLATVRLGQHETIKGLSDFCISHTHRKHYDDTIMASGYVDENQQKIEDIDNMENVKPEYDEDECSKYIKSLSENEKLTYQVHRGKFGLANRGFVYLEHTRSSENVLNVITTGCPDPVRVAAEKKLFKQLGTSWTHGYMLMSGFKLIRDIDSSEVTLLYLQCINPNLVMVPAMLINKLLKDAMHQKKSFLPRYNEHYVKN